MIGLLFAVLIQQSTYVAAEAFSACMFDAARIESRKGTSPNAFADLAERICADEERTTRSVLVQELMRTGKSRADAESMAAGVTSEVRHNVPIIYRQIYARW